MGFGSYDESEQTSQTVELDDDASQSVDSSGFDGEFAFESGANTDDLLTKLGEIKDAKEATE
jgi:hypothetical protein